MYCFFSEKKKKNKVTYHINVQFSAWNPCEVLVTSADSRVRILDGTKVVQKFKGKIIYSLSLRVLGQTD